MSITSTEPDQGARGPVQRWEYMQIPNGTACGAFLAAYPFGVYCHHVKNGSKPCRLRTSKGALPCGYCQSDEPTWRGFTAIYSPQYVRHFTIITEDYKEYTLEIPLGEQIKLARGRAKKAPVQIKQENWRTNPLPERAEKTTGVCLLPCLLKLWKDAELTAWHYSTDNAVSLPVAAVPAAVARRSVLTATPEEERALIGSAFHVKGSDGPPAGGPALIGDVLDALPSPNGKPKKPR